MAAVLTLDRTRLWGESCSLSCSAEPSEVFAGEGDTAGREGLESADMGDRKRTAIRASGTAGPSPPHALPSIGYHAGSRPPNGGVRAKSASEKPRFSAGQPPATCRLTRPGTRGTGP